MNEEKIKKKESISERILKTLLVKKSTVEEIALDIGIKEEIIRTTIYRMKKKDLILETGINRNKYKEYMINKEQVLGKQIIDTNILIKMIPPFVEHDIEISLTKTEIERIKELYGM